MVEVRKKSKLLTAFLEYRIRQKYKDFAEDHMNSAENGDFKHVKVHIFTPSNPEERGTQLSLSFSVSIVHVFEELTKRGVVVGTSQSVLYMCLWSSQSVVLW